MKVITKEQLIAALEDIVETIKGDDSFEGRIEYHAESKDAFEVDAFWRVGNSEGQGGSAVI